jgi:hypothetical protein
MTPVSKLIHRETALFVAETASTETAMSVSQTFHGETPPIPEATYTETMTPVSKLIHRETSVYLAVTASTLTAMSVSQTFHGQTASPIPETKYTETMTPVSKLIHRETAFSVHETAPTEVTMSVSQTFHGESTSPIPEATCTETMTPVSKLIHRETDFSLPETVPTETAVPVSKTISRNTASPVPEIICAETTNVNSDTTIPASHTTVLVSDTPLTDVIIPVSKLIPTLNIQEADSNSTTELHFNLQTPGTDSTVKLLSEALIPQPTVDKSGFKSTTISQTAETEQPEHLVSMSSPAMHEASEVSNTHKEHVCQKAGIQCMDSLTLAACLPDLTLSYTISCRTLLPYMTSKHHVIYCDHRLDTCALAPLRDRLN